jgi:hypothetical protein
MQTRDVNSRCWCVDILDVVENEQTVLVLHIARLGAAAEPFRWWCVSDCVDLLMTGCTVRWCWCVACRCVYVWWGLCWRVVCVEDADVVVFKGHKRLRIVPTSWFADELVAKCRHIKPSMIDAPHEFQVQNSNFILICSKISKRSSFRARPPANLRHHNFA